ncbi:Bifunctional protein TilS/HprT [Frankliniella fusca]|uniref:Bifunctional protein TilS/HprT n=1 Tax=Frankliniella fusca TaxID=407009 RepID=A0AAE1HLK5_9NEOP|nr:Bifunctional protein TilS/HprT [Frankliniella fusca]
MQGDGALSLHWDGKILPDFSSEEKVNRLPVLVAAINPGGEEQLLGVPKVAGGDAGSEFDAIKVLINEWGVKDRIRAMGFDTTASNTGRHTGVCVRVERYLEKDLLYLACRHHIFEIVLGGVFKMCLGDSKSPTITLCGEFKTRWPSFAKDEHLSGISDKVVERLVGDEKQDIINFCYDQLKVTVRADRPNIILRHVSRVSADEKRAIVEAIRVNPGSEDSSIEYP